MPLYYYIRQVIDGFNVSSKLTLSYGYFVTLYLIKMSKKTPGRLPPGATYDNLKKQFENLILLRH